MYSTVLCYRMDKTVSKHIKVGQTTLNGVAALDSCKETALGWIERVPMGFRQDFASIFMF